MLLLVLTGLSWMMQIISMMKFLLSYGVALGSFIGLTALMIPFILSIIVPFVTFIAVIFVYNKMISENEVTVMMASSLSPWQLARPALGMATVLTLLHLALNLWVVPMTQAKFYDTQWNLRYGLAHMKLQESAFTRMADGLVVYVDRVSGHDLSELMLSDTRNEGSRMTIFAEKGKLISTARGLSIVMTNGSLQISGDSIASGTFDTFDMDLNVAEQGANAGFRVRRMSTDELISSLDTNLNQSQQRKVLSELCTRLFGPIMNLILAALCALILLRSSLLRRRISFAPAVAVLCMAGAMGLFMSLSNMLDTVNNLIAIGVGQLVILGLILFILRKK